MHCMNLANTNGQGKQKDQLLMNIGVGLIIIDLIKNCNELLVDALRILSTVLKSEGED